MKAADAGSGMRRGFHKSVRASQKMLRAATRGDIRTLEDQLLVEFHVDAVDSGGNGHSSLHAASEAGQDECVRWLIQKGCDVNIASTKHGHTPLHIAGSPVVARVLLEAGASAVAKDKMRQTPLQRFRSIRMSGDEKSRVLATQILEVLVSWGTDDGTQKVDRIRRTTLVRTNSGAGLNLPAIDGNRANMPSSVRTRSLALQPAGFLRLPFFVGAGVAACRATRVSLTPLLQAVAEPTALCANGAAPAGSGSSPRRKC